MCLSDHIFELHTYTSIKTTLLELLFTKFNSALNAVSQISPIYVKCVQYLAHP